MSKDSTANKSIRDIESIMLQLKHGVDDFSQYVNDDDIGYFRNEWHCAYDNSECVILFKFEDMETVNSKLEKIYEEVRKYVTDLRFDTYFEQHFFKCNINNPNSCIQKYVSYYQDLPIDNYICIYPIHGITIDENVVTLPTLKIINKEHFIEYLKQLEYPLIHRVEDLLEHLSTHSSFIEFIVSARNNEMANDIAKDMMIYYESCFRIIANEANISITNAINNTNQSISFFINPGKNAGRNITPQQGFRDYSFTLNNDVLIKPEFCGIIKLINITNKNDIQNRVQNAIKWLGKSYGEKDSTIALIEAFFALESLFSKEGTGNIKTRIAEYTSFILGKNFESRVQIYDEIIRLYGIRSNVVHGKNAITTLEHINIITQYTREAIFAFFTNAAIKDINKIKGLESYIKKLRFL